MIGLLSESVKRTFDVEKAEQLVRDCQQGEVVLGCAFRVRLHEQKAAELIVLQSQNLTHGPIVVT